MNKEEGAAVLYIGKELQDRMDLLGLTTEEVADETFLEEDAIKAIINNEISLEDIDEFAFLLLCSVLHCKEDFFTNPEAGEDFLSASINRGLDNEKSMNVKVKLQEFMNDFAFVMEILSEVM